MTAEKHVGGERRDTENRLGGAASHGRNPEGHGRRKGGRPAGSKNKPKSLLPPDLANEILLRMQTMLPPEHMEYMRGVIKEGKAISTQHELDTLIMLLSRNLMPVLVEETVPKRDVETGEVAPVEFRKDVTERLKVLNSLLGLRHQVEKRNEPTDTNQPILQIFARRGIDPGRIAVLLDRTSGVAGDSDGIGRGTDDLEPYQIRFLNDPSRFRLVNKSRQIGFSTVISGEMIATAATRAAYKANVVSINQKEAADKINIARNFYHSIPDDLKESGLKPVLWTDSENEISLHKPPQTSVIISQPASAALRGGRKDIYFDEAAHIREFSMLYQAGLPAIIRGGGSLTIVSTPLGQNGLFFEIATDRKAYEQYSVHTVPRWESSVMVRPGALADALAEAPTLDTKSRVMKFGAPTLIDLFKGFGNDIISFQTEFECMFVDEAEAFYPIELINAAVIEEPNWNWKEIPDPREFRGQFSIGVDLAKERDESVFTVVEHVPDVEGKMHRFVRYVYATRAPYSEQMNSLRNLVQKVRPSRVSIDKTGVGNIFVEQSQSLVGLTANLEGVTFDNKKKDEWATRFKRDLQEETVHFPRIPELVRQTHEIRRTKTESNFFKFAGKKNDDYFWSMMLAMYGENRVAPRISIL